MPQSLTASYKNQAQNNMNYTETKDNFTNRVRAFKAILADVEPSSVEETLENFQRDANPEIELGVWEQIVLRYQWYLNANPGLTQLEKKDVFAVLLGLSMGAQDFSNIKNLSAEKVEDVITNYS